MWPLEDLRENWKVALAIGVLLVVNVLTFSAQEMSLQRERELSASLLGNAQESANREARLLATMASQATRVSELESALRAAGQLPDATPTPEKVSGAASPSAATVAVLADAPWLPTASPWPRTSTPTPTPTSTPTATARPPGPTPPPPPTATATAVVNPSSPATATAGSAASAVRYVSTPDGRGVRVRLDCVSNSATAGVWADGTRVTMVETSPSCPGWLRVQDGAGAYGWVAEILLAPAPPG